MTGSYPQIGIKPHTHTHTHVQSQSDGDSNEGLRRRCRWCSVTSIHRYMHRIRFTPTESVSTSTSHLLLFHKTSWEDDTSAGARLPYLSLSFTHKEINEERGERASSSYSDGVSSPHQSRMAANPLLRFFRKKVEARRRKGRGQEDVTEYICIQGKVPEWAMNRLCVRPLSAPWLLRRRRKRRLKRRWWREIYSPFSGCVKLKRWTVFLSH